MEKEMKKGKIIKRIIPLLCATLLLLGSCVTVCAEELTVKGTTFEYTYNMSQLVNIINERTEIDLTEYDVKYQMLMYGWSESPLVVTAYISTEPFCKRMNKEYQQVYTKGYCGYIDFIIGENGEISVSHVYATTPQHNNILNRLNDLSQCIYYVNEDIIDESGDVFFQRPRMLAELAIPLTEAVQNQSTVIVPIAVGCLALLIGLTILAKKLRIFL